MKRSLNLDKLTRRAMLGLPSSHGGTEALVHPVSSPSLADASVPVTRAIARGESASGASDSLQIWITDKTRRVSAGEAIVWKPSSAPAADNAIVILPEHEQQEILGFGAAFTDSACYLISKLTNVTRSQLFRKLFAPEEMNLNVCRICMGSSDCSTSVFSYDDGSVDPDLERFSIAHDETYILPILRDARALNPDLFLFASPWSPPGWMKSNGSMLGGCMRHTYMASYANYFLKFLRSYAAAGVPVQAVTIQNEVDTDQDGTMPACAWPQDYEADFVTMHLGPLLQRAGVSTKIWIVDHNYNLWGRAIGELETPDVRKYTNAIAWHGYEGKPEWIRRVQDAFPDAEMYWTEGGPDYKAPDYQTDWAKWGETFSSILRNCCRSLTVWTLLSNERGQPYIGKGGSGVGGAILLDSNTQQFTYSGMFWALAHFSRFVRRGAIRIESRSPSEEVLHCAFQNPDESIVVVLTNSGPERSREVRLNDRTAEVRLPADSICTLLCPALART